MLCASLTLPSLASATRASPPSLIWMPSDEAICRRLSVMCFEGQPPEIEPLATGENGRGTLCVSVVAKTKMTWAGGSSRVFSRALKASLVSM